MHTWNWDPVVLLNLGVLWWLYGRGLTRIWGKAGVGRGVGRMQAAAFLAALVAIFVALISPLDALSEELASAHMVQHLLLMLVAAPLFILSAPALVLTWGLPRPWRLLTRRWPSASSPLWQPLLPWSLYALTLWIWHIPALYGTALRQPIVHDVQHLTFFASACLYWRVLIDPISRQRLHAVAAAVYLFTTSLHASALGIFLAFSPRPWYGDYAWTTTAWDLTPLEDQQLAGLIMWMPACLIYALLAAALLAGWLHREASTDEAIPDGLPLP